MMGRLSVDVMKVEAELKAPVAIAQLVRFDFSEPIDSLTRGDNAYRLDLCLTPRPGNARACYLDHWNSRRFERIGNLFLHPPQEVLHTRSDGCCQQASIICQLQPEILRTWFDDELHWTDRHLLASLDMRDANIQSLMLRLVQEARYPGFASETLVELISAQLAIELTRYCVEMNEPTFNGGLASWRLKLIDERLKETGEPPTLTELSKLCRLSVRQLTRCFRASRGCSIGDYIAASRIEQAKRRLATDESVKAIAFSLGFASSSSFCFAFRRATGETPSQFRTRILRTH